MKPIPLTRARHASNFAMALEQKGIPVERHLSRANLSADLLDNADGDGIISAISMLDFAESAAMDSGIRDLGFWAGTTPLSGYGNFGARVAFAPSLYGAIKTFCNEVLSECSEADYYLSHEESRAWFCHGPVPDPSQQQHELYALMIMTQVIKLALGSDWHPSRVRLQTHNETSLRNNDYLLKTNIEFGAPVTAIEIPFKGLASALKPALEIIHDRKESGSDSHKTRFPTDPAIALQELIALTIKQSRQPTIEVAAEETGLSKRTLQRHLESKATTYTRLVDQVRFNLAIPLLNDESYSVTAISHELGYSNVAHFSRAFRRITGMSPRSYRYLLKQ